MEYLRAKRIADLQPCGKWGEGPTRAAEQKARRTEVRATGHHPVSANPDVRGQTVVLQTRVLVLLGTHKGREVQMLDPVVVTLVFSL